MYGPPAASGWTMSTSATSSSAASSVRTAANTAGPSANATDGVAQLNGRWLINRSLSLVGTYAYTRASKPPDGSATYRPPPRPVAAADCPLSLAAAVAPVRLLGVEFAGLGPGRGARSAGGAAARGAFRLCGHAERRPPEPASVQAGPPGALRRRGAPAARQPGRGAVGAAVRPPGAAGGAGSDLTASLFDRIIAPDDPVVVLGGSAETAAGLARATGCRASLHHNPPMGFERDPAALEAAIRFLEDHPARFCFLAVGSPRQEWSRRRWSGAARPRGIGLCIGASLLFLTGAERRAPRAVQAAGLEWAWRLVQDPRRLARRYLVDSPRIVRLLWREARRRGADATA